MSPRRSASGVAKAARRTRVSRGQHNLLTVLYSTLGAWTAAILLNLAGIPWGWVLAAGLLATLVLHITLNRQVMLSWLRSWAIGGSLLATTWMTYAVATTPLNQTSGGGLLVVALFWIGWQHWRNSPDTRPVSPLRRMPDPEQTTPEKIETRRWEAALRQVGVSWVTVNRIDEHPGHEIVLHCSIQPGKGHSVQAVRNAAADLDVALNVRTGATRVQRGTGAAELTIHISTRDIFASVIDLPPDTGPLDINEPLTLGLYEDGTPTELLFRERCLGVFGMRGGGKTNFLDCCTCMITRTTNALIWVSDIAKGSQFIRPWMRNYLNGKSTRPPFDWCAVTEAETAKMLYEAYLYIDLRCLFADDKHIPTDEEPAIFLIIEEYTTLVSSKRKIMTHDGKVWTFDQLILEIIRLGRGAAIDVELAAQRATTSMTGRNSGGDIKSQLDVKIGLKCATRMDVSYVFGECPEINPAEFNHKGMMLIQDMDSPVLASKSFRVERTRIPELADETADRRPSIESRLVDSQHSKYYRARWSQERTADLRLVVSNTKKPEPQQEEPSTPEAEDQETFSPQLRLVRTQEKDPMVKQESIGQGMAETLSNLDQKLAAEKPNEFRFMQLVRAAREQGAENPVEEAKAHFLAEQRAAAEAARAEASATPARPGDAEPSGPEAGPEPGRTLTLAEHVLEIIGQSPEGISLKGIREKLAERSVSYSPGAVANAVSALAREEQVRRGGHGQYLPIADVA